MKKLFTMVLIAGLTVVCAIAGPVRINRATCSLEGDFIQRAAGEPGATISVSDISIRPGETQDVDIYMTNEVLLWGLQINLTLPEGLTARNIRIAPEFVNAETYYDEDSEDYVQENVLSSNFLADQHEVRILLSNLSRHYKIQPHENLRVITFKVTADENIMASTDKQITVSIFRYIDATTDFGEGIDGQGTSSSVTILPAYASEITLSNSSLSLNIGDSFDLSATVLPTNATQEVTWKSNNRSVATIDANGHITAVAMGSATITATTTDETELSAYCLVSVRNDNLCTSITLNKSATSIPLGTSEQLTANLQPAAAQGQELVWSSSNEDVAIVDNNGNVAARSVGKATISATTTDGSNLSATCEVAVEPPLAQSISLNTNNAEISVGNTLQLTATIAPAAAIQSVQWKSSNTDIATVDNNGQVQAIAEGSTIITATTTDGTNLSAICSLNVISSVNLLTVSNYNITRGDTIAFAVGMDNESEIAGFQFDIVLPEGFSIALKNNGKPDVSLNANRKDDHVMITNDLGNNTLRVLAYSSNFIPFAGETGDICHINIVSNREMTGGQYTIVLNNIELSDPVGMMFRSSGVLSNVTVKEYIRGDVNGDGKVSVADIIATANKAVGLSPDPFIFGAADCNNDGNITVSDVIIVANLSVGLNAAPFRAPVSEQGAATISLNATDNGNVDIDLNTDETFAGVQFDLSLPNGLSLADVRLSDDNAQTHQIIINRHDNGAALIVFSPIAEALNGTGNLLSLNITDNGYTCGDIRLSRILASTPNGIEKHLPDALISGQTTGLAFTGSRTSVRTEDGMLVIETPNDVNARVSTLNGMTIPLRLNAGSNRVSIPVSGLVMVTIGESTYKVLVK